MSQHATLLTAFETYKAENETFIKGLRHLLRVRVRPYKKLQVLVRSAIKKVPL